MRANVVCPGAKTRICTGPDYEAQTADLHCHGLLDEASMQGALDAPPPKHVAPTYAYPVSDQAWDVTGRIVIAAGGFVGEFARPTPSFLAYRDHHDSPPWSELPRAAVVGSGCSSGDGELPNARGGLAQSCSSGPGHHPGVAHGSGWEHRALRMDLPAATERRRRRDAIRRVHP